MVLTAFFYVSFSDLTLTIQLNLERYFKEKMRCDKEGNLLAE